MRELHVVRLACLSLAANNYGILNHHFVVVCTRFRESAPLEQNKAHITREVRCSFYYKFN